MGAIDELRQLFRGAFEERMRVRDYDRGLLGDGQGNLHVDGDAERRVWFRKNGQPSQLLKVHCYLARPMDDLPVVCGTVPEQPELYQVLTWDRLARELIWQGMSSVAHHGEMHTWYEDDGMDDPVWVWTRALMPFRVSPQDPPDLTIWIEGPELYLWGTGWKVWAGDASVNLAAHVPAAGLHRYCLIYIDGATSTSQVACSAPIAEAVPINPGGYPVPPAGSIPVGLVYLVGGPPATAAITEDIIVDGRVIVGSTGGSVAPAWPCQTVVVAKCNGDFELPSEAITYINSLGDAAPNKPYVIKIMAGYYADTAANITVPRWVNVRAQGEGTIWDLGDYELVVSADASVENIVVTSTGDDGALVMQVSGDNVTLRNVRLILTGAGNDGLWLNNYAGIELYHVVLEATAVGGTAIYCNGPTDALLWDVEADDTTYWGTAALYLDNGAVVTTKFCEFRAAPGGDDVLTLAGTSWEHFATQFDPNNATLAAGTHVALPTKRFNQEVIVAEEGGDFQLLSEAIAYITAQGDAAANKLYGIKMLAGNYAEAGNVTIPQYVHVFGMGEGTEIEMGANILDMSDDSSLCHVVVEGTGTYLVRCNTVNNVVLREIRAINSGVGSPRYVYYVDTVGADVVTMYNCIAEPGTNSGARGFYHTGSGSLFLESCIADNTYFTAALELDATANAVVSRYCRFHANVAAGDDVLTGAGSHWRHVMIYFDPDNSTVAGTHVALPTKRFNQEVIVAAEGGDFEALSEAVAWIVGQGDAAANKLYGILMLAGNYAEAAPVTIPSHVGVVGQGATRIEMAGNQLNMSDDSYLADVTVVFTSGNGIVADDADCILWHVLSINDGSYCFQFMGDSVIEATHCIAETTSGCSYGFQVRDTANVTMHDCVADDAVNFTLAGLVLANAACTCITRYCTFHGDTDDVWTGAASTWNHFTCQFDPNNSTLLGTENPQVTGKANFRDMIAVGSAAAVSADRWLDIDGSRAFAGANYGVASTPSLGANQTLFAVFGRADVDAAVAAVATYGLYAANPVLGGGASITTNYGLYIAAQASGATDYGVYQAGTEDNRFGGHIIPLGNKAKNLGSAGNRWNTLYQGTSTAAGTSRLFASTKACPICGEKMVRGTGSLCVLGEDRDFVLAHCLHCGNAAMEELRHLPPEELEKRRPPTEIRFLGFKVFEMSGNSRQIRVDFGYGDGITNSTYLGEIEITDFLQMSDAERRAFLLALGRREWDSLEELRLMRRQCADIQVRFDAVTREFIGSNLLEAATKKQEVV